MAPRKQPTTVLGGVEADLARMPAELQRGALAQSAMELARQLDSKTSATSKSMCARALQATLGDLRAQAPPARTHDVVDELSSRREKRIGGA